MNESSDELPTNFYHCFTLKPCPLIRVKKSRRRNTNTQGEREREREREREDLHQSSLFITCVTYDFQQTGKCN